MLLKVVKDEVGKFKIKQVDEEGNSLGLVPDVEFATEKEADAYIANEDPEVEAPKKGKKAKKEEEE